MTRTKKKVLSLCAGMILLATAANLWAAPQTASGNQTLYKRLGGFDALAAVTDDFIAGMAADPQLKRFFSGFNERSLHRIREHVVDFLCQATGGPCMYHGQDMKTAHTGLHITEEDWQAGVKDLNATLDKFKFPDRERSEVLSAIRGLKSDIVGR
ncbi:MAG TPA: group 1 truncated hemoglobin [Terriglobales bacterium]|nr:group 1 truncated hemoglobin [Terriglobales bacterium]